MRNRSHRRSLSLLLSLLLVAPGTTALARAATPESQQQQRQAESPEEKKLREREEAQKKKEDERKEKEAKARAKESKKYNTLREFAEDLYASDPEFREQVDDAYLDLQERHAMEAYQINTTHPKEYISTDREGEVLKIRRALYDNPRVQEYINRLGQSIVPEDSEKLYSFKIMVNPIPTAYTLSTGTVLVSTGMISMLDNEAQLAYVLAHELAHVYKDHWRVKVMMPLAEAEYMEREAKRRAKWGAILGIAGAAVGAGIGGAAGGRDGALTGALVGAGAGVVISSFYSQKMSTDWARAQEDEADDFAMRAVLNRSFDVQEVPRLFATMNDVARRDARAQLGFLGARSRLRERTEYAQRLLGGALQGQYQQLLAGGKLVGAGPEFNTISAELKRDNGIEAFFFDMFAMSRKNLEQAVKLRSDDPLAAYYYGRLLKQTGRTKDELETAQQMFLSAIRLDTRQSIPEVQLHRALILMESTDAPAQAAAVQSLKDYIVAYQKRTLEQRGADPTLPPNVDVLYDYLRLLGEKRWSAPLPGSQRTVLTSAATAQPAAAPAPTPAPNGQPARRRP